MNASHDDGLRFVFVVVRPRGTRGRVTVAVTNARSRSPERHDRRRVVLQAALGVFEIDRLEVDALERVAAKKHAAPVELTAAAGRVRAVVPASTELALEKREALVLLQQEHVGRERLDLLHQNGAAAALAHHARACARQARMFRRHDAAGCCNS